MPHRPILRVVSARDDLRAFPESARRRAGHELDLLQQGLEHMTIKITRGTSNPFTDLGFPPDEAANLQLRSDLIIQLRKRLAVLGDTQAEWAELLGVSQPRVSDLMRGKIERFSVDTLIAFLGKTGAEVRLTVRGKGKAA